MHAQAVSPLRRWAATIGLLPVIAMIISSSTRSTISGLKQIRDELRPASGLSSRHTTKIRRPSSPQITLANLRDRALARFFLLGSRATAMVRHGASLWAATRGGQADPMGSTVQPSSRSIGEPDNRVVLTGGSTR
jgi:hypothetical protein